MNPPCAKCSKTVYPTEKLNCLDKIWHKGCFKCQVCNMTLNMKNYKGYSKLPYCNAHYPTTKHTAVADTPENRRIADNTKIQSNVQYHSDFEKAKGSYTQVSDRLDFKQHQKNTTNISMIKYHEDFERQKGKKMTVVDDPETQRVKQNTQNISQVAYSGHKDQLRDMEYKRPNEQVNAGRISAASPPRSPGYQQEVRRVSASSPPQSPGYQQEVRRVSASSPPQSPGYQQEDVRVRTNPGSIHNYDPMRDQQQNQGTPYSQRNSGAVVYDSSTGRDGDGTVDNPSSQRKVGSISDYDPMNDRWGSVTGQYAQQQPPRNQPPPPQQFQQPPQDGGDRFAGKGEVKLPPEKVVEKTPEKVVVKTPEKVVEKTIDEPPYYDTTGKGMVCRANYDYTEADDDEVSFSEGDFIIFCQPIDQGWMEGTVESTGRRGMLPSNYVEAVKK